MNVLWIGGEETSFPNGLGASASTGGSTHRTGYSRYSTVCGTAGTFNGGLPNYSGSLPFPGGAVTSCWMSAYAYYNATGSGEPWFGLGQSGQAGKGLWVGTGSSSGVLGIATYNGSSYTLLASSSFTVNTTNLYKLDLQVINYGTSATVNLYLNGSLAISYSGSISVTGVTGFDTALLQGNGNGAYLSEFIVADSDTRSLSVLTCAPAGNGTTQAWSNPAYTNFNPIGINDANSTYTNTTGQNEQATMIQTPTGTFSVVAIKIEARAMATSGATATNLKLGINSGGTVGVGSAHALGISFTTYEDLSANNPATGIPFTQTTLNAAQLNLQSA